jgi:flavin reductase (DIM6/NTAB) family NADH-FMN oxidoreductase RutF
MPQAAERDIEQALGLMASSLCVLTAAHDRSRAAIAVRWGMQCSADPVLICVAARKGNGVEPLVRDSHSFALNLVDRADRLLLRTFDRPEIGPDDPFDAFEVCKLVTGSPVIIRAAAALDCEVVRHFDLEDADHELYVGRVLAARVSAAAAKGARAAAGGVGGVSGVGRGGLGTSDGDGRA